MVRQAKAQRILTHDQIWAALDLLAARAGLSPSGLAKRAGLDPTTFNKSKRVTPDGRERLGHRFGGWPARPALGGNALGLVEGGRIEARLLGKPGGR